MRWKRIFGLCDVGIRFAFALFLAKAAFSQSPQAPETPTLPARSSPLATFQTGLTNYPKSPDGELSALLESAGEYVVPRQDLSLVVL